MRHMGFVAVSAAERRDADLFFNDLMGRRPAERAWQARALPVARGYPRSSPALMDEDSGESGNVKPLVTRVKRGEKQANAVLRVLHGLTSILQGYVHDQIDISFRSKLDAQKGWSKAVANALIFVLKRQIPVIQREIKADNFEAVGKAFENLKTELTGQGVSATGVWGVLVTLAKEIIGNAIDDALENTARYAAKKLAKKLLKSAAKAASVIFILEDIALLVHALVTISTYKDRLREFNRVLIAFLARVSPCQAVRAGETNGATVGWKVRYARLDCQVTLNSFAPERGGKPGAGEWRKMTLTTVLDGKTGPIASIVAPVSEPVGKRALPFQVPPVTKWPAPGSSYISVDVTKYNSAGNVVGDPQSLFIAACVP